VSEDPSFTINTAVIGECRSEDLVRRAQLAGQRSHCRIVCLDAERMAGRRHVEAAVRHAIRAYEGGTAIADSLEMEVLLYAGGTRQTSIGRTFGMRPDTRRLYLCFIPASKQAVVEMEPWVRYTEDWDECLDEEKIHALALLFGITREECEAAGRDRIQDLVIERVALLDVYK
jgi:Uncharacterized conserved protein